ncbi:hypothetical protein [Actinomadura flavalba]|uniref:hypothetical protein n=1 Tax=Actinomadura flavalba TaxID=1120938 RepID=UPI000688CF31
MTKIRTKPPELPEGRWTDPLVRTALCLLLVAALFAAWGGWRWYAAAHDDALAFSKLRDDVVQSGEQHVQNLSTLDHRDVAKGLATWRDSSTGELHEQLTAGAAQFEKDVKAAQTITSAKVLSSAVTQLDDRAGKASMILAVRITVTTPDGDPSVKTNRLVAQLERTPGGWKISALGQSPTGAS